MIKNTIIISMAIVAIATIVTTVFEAHAQEIQPPLEEESISANNSKTLPNNEGSPSFTISGKVTIPITTSEQIIIDLPIHPDSKVQIVPIK